MANQATLEFICQHRHDDIRQLALQGRKYPEVDMTYALEQIAGRQKAQTKLPTWAALDGILYPAHISMEQCSSEMTAKYKAKIAGSGTLFVDLTAGFGVDAAFISRNFNHAITVEQQSYLCEISSANYKLLGYDNIQVVCADGVEYLHSIKSADLIFIDPARRDEHGSRTYGIADCTPNILPLLDKLLEKDKPVMDATNLLNQYNTTGAFNDSIMSDDSNMMIADGFKLDSDGNKWVKTWKDSDGTEHSSTIANTVSAMKTHIDSSMTSPDGTRTLSGTQKITFLKAQVEEAKNRALDDPNSAVGKRARTILEFNGPVAQGTGYSDADKSVKATRNKIKDIDEKIYNEKKNNFIK